MERVDDEIEKAWRCVADRMGSIATVIPAGEGDNRNIPVILLLGETDKQVGTTNTWEPMDTIEYWQSDLGREVARGDKFQIDGKTFVVRGIIADNGRFVKAEVGRVA
jgi:hypothetical protein